MAKLSRRRRKQNVLFGSFYLNPGVQYATTIVSAIALAGFVFSGFLLFRFTDSSDLLARGKRQLAEGKVAWAARTFKTLVNKHPGNYEGHVRLGEAYLELDERRLAEQEFRIASSLKTRDGRSNGADIAMSKLAVARQDYNKAESILLEVYKKNRKDREVREALFELYDSWGDAKMLEPDKDYPAVIRRYERALRYASDYEMEERVKEKLIQSLSAYANVLATAKDREKSIAVLRKSLRYRYLPETLVEIAKSYEEIGKLDEAIDWYRKAYDANPSVISIRLANILVQKGRQLLDEKKPKEAEKYFAEADKISKNANVPLDILYPVKISDIRISTKLDDETGELEPVVKIKVVNEAARPLHFLVAKAVFSSGDEEIAVVQEVIASPEKPLGAKSTDKATKEVTIKLQDSLNIHQLNKNKLSVRIFIAYNEGEEQIWKVKAIQEAIIRSASTPQPPSGQAV